MFVECVVPENLLKKRLLLRKNKQLKSDARISVYAPFRKHFEPLAEVSDAHHIIVDTQNPLEECMQQILKPDFSQAIADKDLRYEFGNKNSTSGLDAFVSESI